MGIGQANPWKKREIKKCCETVPLTMYGSSEGDLGKNKIVQIYWNVIFLPVYIYIFSSAEEFKTSFNHH